MLNLPGDLIRRAATNVSSTVSSVSSTVSNTVSSGVSTVASVATGSRRRSMDRNSTHQDMDQVLANAKEKYALTLKCTPNKDAVTTANLSIRSGYIMKRNEQGIYHKKFVCIVPHSFLYYFDSDTADTPRGIIDLELYTNLSREDNTLKMSTSDEEKLRVFYFEDEDRENLNNWLTTISRERFQVIFDERNAYQQMQIDMTGVLDSASLVRKSTEAEKENLESDLNQSNRSFAEAMSILQSMLVIVGITEEDMSKLSDVNKIGYALKKGIIELKSGMEKKYDESLEIIEQMSMSHQSVVEELQDKLRIEQQIRKELELNMIIERKEAEAKVASSISEVDNAMMNFQIAVTSRTAAETKCTTLSEQKKILVKEVKQLRKKVDDTNESVEMLKSLNEKLSLVTAELQEQLKAAQEALALNLKADVDARGNDTAAALLLENSKALSNLHTTEGGHSEERSPSAEHSHSHQQQSSFSKLTTKLFSGSSSHHEGDRTSTHGGSVDNDHDTHTSTTTNNNNDETRMNWEASPSQLKELGWLSPEQNKLLDRRLSETVHHEDSPSHQQAQQQSKSGRSSMYMFSSAMSMMGSSSDAAPSASSNTVASTDNSTTQPKESRRSSLGMMASMFTSSLTSNATKDKPAVAQSAALNPETSAAHQFSADDSNSAFSSLIEDDPERLPSAMRLKCLRCEGSVEGPKYSTCKCSVPALTPEDLSGVGSSISMLTGFMSKGSSAVAGGFMKAGNAAMTYSTSSSASSSSSGVGILSNSSNHSSVRLNEGINVGNGNGGGALDEELSTNSVTSEDLPRASFNSLLDNELGDRKISE